MSQTPRAAAGGAMENKTEITEMKSKPLKLRRTKYLQEECRNKSETQQQRENSELEHNYLRTREIPEFAAAAARDGQQWLAGLAGICVCMAISVFCPLL
jgi:hypothetical protein